MQKEEIEKYNQGHQRKRCDQELSSISLVCDLKTRPFTSRPRYISPQKSDPSRPLFLFLLYFYRYWFPAFRTDNYIFLGLFEEFSNSTSTISNSRFIYD
jgi:hypothetical protein